jgi:hypothetical protein
MKSIHFLVNKEFVDIIIPCILEAADKSPTSWTIKLRMEVYEKLICLREDKEFNESQRNELRRLSERLKTM